MIRNILLIIQDINRNTMTNNQTEILCEVVVVGGGQDYWRYVHCQPKAKTKKRRMKKNSVENTKINYHQPKWPPKHFKRPAGDRPIDQSVFGRSIYAAVRCVKGQCVERAAKGTRLQSYSWSNKMQWFSEFSLKRRLALWRKVVSFELRRILNIWKFLKKKNRKVFKMSWNGFLLVGLFTLYLWFDVTQAEVNLNNVRLGCK